MKKYLADSDFLFALFVKHDPSHSRARKLFKRVKYEDGKIMVLNLVIQESATVLSKKDSQKTAITFLNEIGTLPIVRVVFTEEDEQSAWEMFRGQTKKGISFIDCANLAVAQKYKFDGILSFDEFYTKSFRVE